jgi:type I restriction enzyme S subunit
MKQFLFDSELPQGWRIVTVDELKSPEPRSCVAGPFGSSISSKYFVPEGVPVIRGSNLRDDLTRFVPEGFVFVSSERAKSYRAQHVKAGDLVFTCWGTLGQVGLIPDDGPFSEYIISNKQLKLRPNSEIADSEFLFYYFGSPQMVNHIRSIAIGAAVPGINLGLLKGLKVALPPLVHQRSIASFLSAYDNLIENNTRRIKILEQIAEMLYREWFVNFRFPGHEKVKMVESEMGLIPERWAVTTLKDVASFIGRGISPAYDDSAEGLVINQKCIRDGKLLLAQARRQSKKVPEEKVVQEGDVLINSTGVGTLGRIAQVLEPIPNCTVDSHVSIVRPKRNSEFLGRVLLSMEDYFAAQGVGSTGQTELGRERIGSTQIVKPPERLQEEFCRTVSPMNKMLVCCIKKNEILRNTRDLLLPKLVSGEVSVEAIEKEALAETV